MTTNPQKITFGEMREIDRYLIAAGSRPVHIAEICATFKVHRRALYRAFIEAHGIPPITYLRRKRLDDVRAALLTAGPGTMVRDIARAHGFVELGRFAASYRALFGELPSQTLRRARLQQWPHDQPRVDERESDDDL
jgi:transcriptional regulator GlxA family with amidase domain